MDEDLEDLKVAAAGLLGVDVEKLPLVLDIPVAGKLADLNKGRSYAAAKDRSMETIVIAGRMKVPTLRGLKKLSGDGTA